jgi:hypothetical protein
MNKREFEAILKKAQMPERSGEFWESFPEQITRRLNRDRTQSPPVGHRWFPKWAWGLATAVCVAVAFAVGLWHGRMEATTSGDVLANVKVVRETLAMFPNRVRAITEDAQGLNLILSDSKNVPSSAALYVRICDGKHCASVVTFSGQEIQVAGQKLTVLSDAEGGVILVGDHFAWSSREPAVAGTKLNIVAKNLGPIAM